MFQITWVRIVLGVLVGGVGGYLWYRFVGCTTGTCPITANPFISTGYGMIMGGLIAA